MAKIDQINARILRVLEKDGRISNTDLAGKVGLSSSACLRRVQELERSGVIKGYRAVLDGAAINVGFVGYVMVHLSDHSRTAQEDFELRMASEASVRECHGIAGNFEYLLRVEVADLASYRSFHMNVLGNLPQIESLSTYIVMGSPKDERA